jgi:hypothetical protein
MMAASGVISSQNLSTLYTHLALIASQKTEIESSVLKIAS